MQTAIEEQKVRFPYLLGKIISFSFLFFFEMCDIYVS